MLRLLDWVIILSGTMGVAAPQLSSKVITVLLDTSKGGMITTLCNFASYKDSRRRNGSGKLIRVTIQFKYVMYLGRVFFTLNNLNSPTSFNK